MLFLTLFYTFLLYIIIKSAQSDQTRTTIVEYVYSFFHLYCNNFYYYLFMPFLTINIGHIFCSYDMYGRQRIECYDTGYFITLLFAVYCVISTCGLRMLNVILYQVDIYDNKDNLNSYAASKWEGIIFSI